MNIFAVSGLINAVSILVLGTFVYFNNKTRELNIRYASFCFFVAFWSFCYFLWQIAEDKNTALFWVRCLIGGAIFIPICFLHFVLLLLDIYESNKKVVRVGYLVFFFFFLTDFTPWFVNDVQQKMFFKFWPVPGPLFSVFLLIWLWYCIYPCYLLIKNYRNFAGLKRQQVKYVLLSILIGYGGGSTNYFLWYDIHIPPYGNILVPLFVGMMAYAVIRLRMMDISIILTRTGIFLIVYTLVLGVPFWIGTITKSWLISTSIAVILASLGPIIFQILRKRAEALILQEQRHYHNILTELSATLTLIKDLDRLLKLIVYRVARAVKVKFACIYLATDGHKFVQKFPYFKFGFVPQLPLDILDTSAVLSYIKQKRKPIFFEELTLELKNVFNLHSGLIVPAFVRDRLLGFLILGPKQSGAVYTEEDAAVFGVLANQMALAIENTEFITESQKTQAQLFAAERMASMGTMAGGMSHQLNNRFHALALAAADAIDTFNFTDISSCSQQVKDSMGSIKYALTRILENVKHGGKIVNDFLDFSQPGKVKREAKEFDLRELLERAIEMVRIKTSFPGDLIEKQIPVDLPHIPGDFVLLQDVFYNLIDNAHDAVTYKEKLIKDGKLTNFVDYKGKIIIRVDQFNDQVRIQINDNGTGMDEETQKQVFVPYFTSKATAYKGAGLGLYIIQKIIAAHHGELNLVSKYGEGSTFTITLPLVQQDKENQL
ncbi:MAG: ATP-binding protein [Candidatus Omnitrophota bacterium]|jgi:two-component system nitrogen regulation sensor histidine kinase GlnL